MTLTLDQLRSDDVEPAGVVGVGSVPVATARRIACEAGIIPVVLGGSGEVLDLGRSRRLASRAQRRALRRTFVGCGVGGCDVPWEWCQVHHLTPWERGGRTDLGALVPLCSPHHHLVHEGGRPLPGWTTARTPSVHRAHHQRRRSGSTPPTPARHALDRGRVTHPRRHWLGEIARRTGVSRWAAAWAPGRGTG